MKRDSTKDPLAVCLRCGEPGHYTEACRHPGFPKQCPEKGCIRSVVNHYGWHDDGRACWAVVESSLSTCPRCGHAADEPDKCPCHCHLVNHEHVYRCQDCGETKPAEADAEDPDCGARTNYGNAFVECNKQHTHYGPHRVQLPDGRIFKWEPKEPPSDEEPEIRNNWQLGFGEGYEQGVKTRTARELSRIARGLDVPADVLDIPGVPRPWIPRIDCEDLSEKREGQ